MSKGTLEILTNNEVIAIDQDSLGIQGFRHTGPDSLETWYKPLKGGTGRYASSTGDQNHYTSGTIGRRTSLTTMWPAWN